MAKGILSVVGKHSKKDDSAKPFAIMNVGKRERLLYRSGDVGRETLAERKIAQLHVVTTLLEGSTIALKPEELAALGDMLEQMVADVEDSAFLDLVDEDELTGREVPIEEAAQ